MNDINLLDETFDKNQSHNYHMSIQTGNDGFSLCLLDTIRNKYIAFQHHPMNKSDHNFEEIISKIQSDPLLKLPYKSVSHILTDGKSTLVPALFFEEKKEKLIFQFNQVHEDSSEVLFNNLSSAMVVNIFAYPKTYLTKLKEIYPNLKAYHRSSPFIETLVQNSAKWANPKCFVAINKKEIDIGIAQKKKLEFFNSFTYKENTDIVYYILNIIEQFKLSAMETEVYISVDLENHDEIFEFLNNYLNLIKFIHPSDQYTYSYIFDELQLTRFANLFNLALCA